MEDKDIKILESIVNYRKIDGIYSTNEVIFKVLENLLQAYKQDEKVIEEMAKYMVQEMAEYQLDEIYAELYNCNGLDRNWTRGDEEEIKDILKYFRKKCE